jgi:hypothetical protein
MSIRLTPEIVEALELVGVTTLGDLVKAADKAHPGSALHPLMSEKPSMDFEYPGFRIPMPPMPSLPHFTIPTIPLPSLSFSMDHSIKRAKKKKTRRVYADHRVVEEARAARKMKHRKVKLLPVGKEGKGVRPPLAVTRVVHPSKKVTPVKKITSKKELYKRFGKPDANFKAASKACSKKARERRRLLRECSKKAI